MSTTTGTTTPSTTTPASTIQPTTAPITTIPTTIVITTTITPTFTTSSTTGQIQYAPIPQAPPQQIVFQHNQDKLSKFSGNSKDIRIQTWLKLFEVHTIAYSNAQRVQHLLYYLSDAALEWYGDDVANNIANPQYTWDFIKQKMVRRFGCSTAQPLIEAKDLSLQRDQTLEEYYRAKIRLLNQTSLSEHEKIQMLTAGLPHSWIVSLAPIPITTTDVWFESAQRVEALYSKPVFKKDFKPRSPNRSQHSFQLDSNPSTEATHYTATESPAPYPCRDCQQEGLNEYHWHRQCPIKANYGQRSRDYRQTTPKQIDNRSRKPIKADDSTAEDNQSRDSSSESTTPRQGIKTLTVAREVISVVSTEQVMSFVEVDVKLNGIPIKSFVDSGSTLSVVSEKTFKRLKVQLMPNTSITLDQISGQTKTIGCFTTQLQIGNQTKSVKLHVIIDCHYPLLLGMDLGKLFGLQLDLKHSKVSLPSNPSDNECATFTSKVTNKPKLNSLSKANKVLTPIKTDIGSTTSATHKGTVPQPPNQMLSQPQSQQLFRQSQQQRLPQTNTTSQQHSPQRVRTQRNPNRNSIQFLTTQSHLSATIDKGYGHSKSHLNPGISMGDTNRDSQRNQRTHPGKYQTETSHKTKFKEATDYRHNCNPSDNGPNSRSGQSAQRFNRFHHFVRHEQNF